MLRDYRLNRKYLGYNAIRANRPLNCILSNTENELLF